MAIKSVLLLGVVMASVLLICQDVAYARVLTEANGFQGKNVEPARKPGLEGEKWFVGVGGGFGPEIGGYYQPVFGPGYTGGGVYGGYSGGPGYTGGVYPGGVYPGYVGVVGGGVGGRVSGYGYVPGY